MQMAEGQLTREAQQCTMNNEYRVTSQDCKILPLSEFRQFWQLVGRYCSYVLPRKDSGTFQIQVNENIGENWTKLEYLSKIVHILYNLQELPLFSRATLVYAAPECFHSSICLIYKTQESININEIGSSKHKSVKHPSLSQSVKWSCSSLPASFLSQSKSVLKGYILAGTGPKIILCSRFGDICYCCSQTSLPGPACLGSANIYFRPSTSFEQLSQL